MNFEELLKGKTDCECGKVHSCPIKAVEIGHGAIEAITKYSDSYKKIIVVCDENTYNRLAVLMVTVNEKAIHSYFEELEDEYNSNFFPLWCLQAQERDNKHAGRQGQCKF